MVVWCIVLFYARPSIASITKISPDECTSLGFNSQILQCSTCDTIKKVVVAQDGTQEVEDMLVSKCQSCCIETAKVEKFDSAILEVFEYFFIIFVYVIEYLFIMQVDKRFAAFYNHLSDILAARKELGFSLKNKFGAAPTLLMYRKGSEEPADQINLANFDVGMVKEYLSDHLKKKDEKASKTKKTEKMTSKKA